MFKSKEELIKENTLKKEDGHCVTMEESECDGAYEDGVEDAFKSFAYRLKVYEECLDRPWITRDKYPVAFTEFERKHKYSVILIDQFNNWLFDYCFEGVK